MAEWVERQKVCDDCGHPIEMCSDPERDWYPQRTVCWATANQLAATRRYELLHEQLPYHDGTFDNWSKHYSADTPYRFDDGVTIWVAPIDYGSGGDFLEQGVSLSDDYDDGEVD